MNLFIVSGNLGSDAEVKHTQNGKSVTTFSLAAKSGWGDSQKTTWIRCDYWGDRGAKVSPYLTKGSKPTVTGEIYMDEYEGKQYLKMNVREVELPPKGVSNAPANHSTQPSSPQPQQNAEVFDSDIPF